MKIAITNTVLSNSGDAAIFEGILEALRRQSNLLVDDIVVFDSNARETRHLYPNLDVRQQYSYPPTRHWRAADKVRKAWRLAVLRTLSVLPGMIGARLLKAVNVAFPSSSLAKTFSGYIDCDVVISSGGTYLVDHYNFRPRVDELVFAKSIGVKDIVLWTQSVGPFNTGKSARDARLLARYVTRAHFRDERSNNAWKTISAESNKSFVNADAAFALDPPVVDDGSTRKKAILSVREWHSGLEGEALSPGRYSEAYRSCAQLLVERSLHPIALSTCQGLPGYNVDDSVVAANIFDSTDTLIDSRHRSPAELMLEIQQSSVVVTTRMHLAILALLCQTPVVAIAYEYKTIDLFNSVGLAECAIPIEKLTATWLTGQLERVLNDPQSWQLTHDQLYELRSSAQAPAVGIF